MKNNKQTRGRQRIDTSRRRENEEDRLITFSKRRTGLYKKASELCTLCGIQLALLIFSPSGKPFSFAHPNIDTIARRFLKRNPTPNEATDEIMDGCLKNKINELNERLTQLINEGEAEKERGRNIARLARARQNKPLCDQNIDRLNDDEAQKLKVWLHELQVRINNRLEELVANPTAGIVDPNVASSSHGRVGTHF